MDSRWEPDLITLCRAVEFDDDSRCQFAGSPVDTDDRAECAAGDLEGGEPGGLEPVDANSLRTALSAAIYAQCYVRHFSGELAPRSPRFDPDFVPDAGFVGELSAANQSRSGWAPGWEVCRVGRQGDLLVRNGDRYRTELAGHYAFAAGPAMQPVVGDRVSLQVFRESTRILPDFYFAFGETLGDQYDVADTVRFYFHLDPDGAPRLLEQLTAGLNQFQVPFKFKCQLHREAFYRLDAAVLYVARRYFDIALRLVMDAANGTSAFLRPEVPLFTGQIHAGVGVAEDPGGDLSFGQVRCDLIADALLDVRTSGRVDPGAFLAALQRRFQAGGWSWERPYLNPGSADLFDSASTELLYND